MSFTVDMDAVYQQFANIFGSLSPLLWPFVGAAIGLFVFGGIVFIFKTFVSNR